MKQELDNLLVKRYPRLFVERNLPKNQSCMAHGVTCKDGWFTIIDCLCANIQGYIDNQESQLEGDQQYNLLINNCKNGNFELFNKYFSHMEPTAREKYKTEIAQREPRELTSLVPQVVITQIKEKFGTLRFYFKGGDNHVRGMVQMAESMTSFTCEECGAPGELRQKRYLYTACDNHTQTEN